MKQIDTTDPKAHHTRLTLLEMGDNNQALDAINRFRILIVGMYYSEVGPDWDSAGKQQTDFLHHIEIPLAGHRQIISRGNTLEIIPGMAYFMPGNTPAERRHLETGSALWLTFRCDWFPGVDLLMDWPDRSPRVLGPFDVSFWKNSLNSEWRSSANHLLQLRSRIENWLAEALPSLDTIINQHLKTHARFESALQLVEEKLGADLRICDLAKAHGTSPHAFSQAFSAATNSTPKEYLNRRINIEAIQLINGTDLTIKEIAYKLRFSDEFYFSRFFKKLNRCSPTEYRARLQRAKVREDRFGKFM